jgi:hypothetical protein
MTMESDELNTTLPAVEAAPTEVEVENKLHSEILSLWIGHQVGKAVANRSNEELKTLRLGLGLKLYQMKSILARTGRGGGWAAYLRANALPRATANRLVDRHETSLKTETKGLSEAIPETTAEDVRRLVRTLLPRLRRILTSPEWVEWFCAEVAFRLETADAGPSGGRVDEACPGAKGDPCGLHAAEVPALSHAA